MSLFGLDLRVQWTGWAIMFIVGSWLFIKLGDTKSWEELVENVKMIVILSLTLNGD